MILRRPSREELRRLRCIADYQFGWPAGDYLIPDGVVVGVSPATRRIREVYSGEGGLIAVLRAHDYHYSLSLLGARMLVECFPPPRHRVVVREAPASKSVPPRLVVGVDEGLRPGDEVVVVDSSDEVIGVGRLRMPVRDILEGCGGEAVRLRKLAVKGG